MARWWWVCTVPLVALILVARWQLQQELPLPISSSSEPRDTPVPNLIGEDETAKSQPESESVLADPVKPPLQSTITGTKHPDRSRVDATVPTENHRTVPTENTDATGGENLTATFLTLRDEGKTTETSTYRKVRCGALVTNFCMSTGGQPVYFTNSRKPFSSSGATLVCNEAGSKHKLHMIMKAPPFSSSGENSNSAVDELLVVIYCWETYGYHLVLCLQATHAHLARLGVVEEVRSKGTIAIIRGSHKPLQLGSQTSWNGGTTSSLKDAHVATHWPLWQLIAKDPRQVMGLAHVAQRCFKFGTFGGAASPSVFPAEAQAAKAAWWDRFGLRSTATGDGNLCSQGFTVGVIQRTKRFAVTNLDDLVGQLRRGLATKGNGGALIQPNVTVLVLEEMPVEQQIQWAMAVDVLVGVHGNGLSWVSLMRPGTALLELWPVAAYNANYRSMSTKSNVAFFSANGNGQCKRRCPASYNLADSLLASVSGHLQATLCRGEQFDTAPMYHSELAEYKRQKALKKQRKSHG